nr:40S ribosomal protein S13 [Ipomoea batatas]
MLPNCNSFLDEVVKILRNLKTRTMGLENPQDFTTSHTLNLSNPMRITKNNTNLGRCKTLLCKFADIVLNLLGRDLQPTGRSPLVWNC